MVKSMRTYSDRTAAYAVSPISPEVSFWIRARCQVGKVAGTGGIILRSEEFLQVENGRNLALQVLEKMS